MELTVGQILEHANSISIVALLLGMVYAVHKKWLVPGWVLVERDARIERLEGRVERYENLLTRTIEPILPDRK